MSKLWSFIRRKSNREILAWAGGGLVIVATGLWAAFTYAFPPSGSKPSAGVSADCSSVAIGGNVSGAVVTAGGWADCSRKPAK